MVNGSGPNSNVSLIPKQNIKKHEPPKESVPQSIYVNNDVITNDVTENDVTDTPPSPIPKRMLDDVEGETPPPLPIRTTTLKLEQNNEEIPPAPLPRLSKARTKSAHRNTGAATSQKVTSRPGKRSRIAHLQNNKISGKRFQVPTPTDSSVK
ncbi:uncharacterized protein LOC144745066 [Ciona intestinalis]